MNSYSKAVMTFMLILLVMVSFGSLAFASAGNKDLDRAIKSYTKKIEYAEQKSCNTQLDKPATALSRSCAKDVSKLDKVYDKYTSDIKADPTIASLKTRHETLRAISKKLDHQAEVEKMARDYLRQINKMETKTCAKKDSYGTRTDELCLEDVLKADAIKARIPADILQEPVIKDLVARHEELRKMPELMAKMIEGARQDFLDNASLQSEFGDTVHNIIYWEYLEKGKENKPDDVAYIESLDKTMPAYKQFAADCKGKYADYVKDKPNHLAKCELAENAEKYRNQFAAASYKVFLKNEIGEINAVIARLNSDDKYIEYSDYKKLVINKTEYINDIKTRINESYKKVGLPEPSYSELEAAIAGIPVAIKSAAKANKWSDKETVSVARPIKKRAAKVVEKMGMKLVKVGRLDQPWTIVKNFSGIPEYMSTKGWVMMKAPKESFCRMQYTTFTRTYDGKDFVPASNVNIVPAIVPVSCD